jgi:hypothetical protein
VLLKTKELVLYKGTAQALVVDSGE